MIEDMNQQLENQNQVLEAKTKEQEKLIRLLDTMEVKAKQARQPIDFATEDTSDTNAHEKENSYYEQIDQLIREDLSELQELHEELDASIISVIETASTQAHEEIGSHFSRYASILGFYPAFESLTSAMQNLTKAMSSYPEPKDSSKTEEIFMFLEAFMYILGKWQKELLEQSDEKVDQLDVSIIGDLETITNMWLAEKETSPNCEIEFF